MKVVTVHHVGTKSVHILTTPNGNSGFADDIMAKNEIKNDMVRYVNDAGLEDYPVSTIEELCNHGWYVCEESEGGEQRLILSAYDPEDTPGCDQLVYNILDFPEVNKEAFFRDEADFDDSGLCDYYDVMENAILALCEKDNKQIPAAERCAAIDTIREELCTEFHGCYPSREDTDEYEDLPCYLSKCKYDCESCPMLVWHCFPQFVPEDDSLESCTKELIRCVKCSQTYEPDENEIKKAIMIVRSCLS